MSNRKTIDIMVDLETLGTRPGCAILAIGACTLDTSEQFYSLVDSDTCKAEGMFVDTDTLMWWYSQEDSVREEAFSGTSSIAQSLHDFTCWITQLNGGSQNNSNIAIWGNGGDFDLPILAEAYRIMRMNKPWSYNACRCVRTMRALAPYIKAPEFEGHRHNALDDAKNQAKHVTAILNMLQPQRTSYLPTRGSEGSGVSMGRPR